MTFIIPKYKFDKEKHIHYLDDKPLMGTSSVCKIIAKPLTWWASGKAVETLGWTNNKIRVNNKYEFVPYSKRSVAANKVLRKIKKMTGKRYVDLLDEAYRAHNTFKEEAADKGTDRHEILESYIKTCINQFNGAPELEGHPDIKLFVEWAKKNIKRFLWSEVHGYSQVLWTGGIADVGWEDLRGRVVAGDFKSSKDAYFDQFVQVAGYDTMLSENGGFTADGEKIFDLPGPIEAYCVVPFGQQNGFNPVIMENVNGLREAFRSTVYLYKLYQSYNEI